MRAQAVELTPEERKALWGGLRLAQMTLKAMILAMQIREPENRALRGEARRRLKTINKLLKKFSGKALRADPEIE